MSGTGAKDGPAGAAVLPAGVELGPLGSRLLAAIVDGLPAAILSAAYWGIMSAVDDSNVVMVASIGLAILLLAWAVLVWWSIAVRSASPGMRLMRLQIVGLKDGRAIGWGRAFLRYLVYAALSATVIGWVLLIIFMITHVRHQGWHDRCVDAVVIKERVLIRNTSTGIASVHRPAGASSSSTVGLPQRMRNRQTFTGDAAPGSGGQGVPAQAGPQDSVPWGNQGGSGDQQQAWGQQGNATGAGDQQPGWGQPQQGWGQQGQQPQPGQPAWGGQQAGPGGWGEEPASYGQNFQQQDPGQQGFGPQAQRQQAMEHAEQQQQQSAAQPPMGHASGPISAVPGIGAPPTAGPQSHADEVAPAQGEPNYVGSKPSPQTDRVEAEPAPEGEDEDGTTLASRSMISSARSPKEGWAVLINGQSTPVNGLVLVGRNPKPPAGDEGAELIKVDSKKVSKTHLAVGVDQRGLWIMDRGSTNGTAIRTTSGALEPCAAGELVRVRAGQTIAVGDVQLEIRRAPASKA
ncbi:RDD family protein [Parenemella sanctibonifatiensis]|uniref:FHA domain-containing protein n=1 Tax=Parenemella sanctibonifatiensis TaxID=2016505 RepID=A0A255EBB5_9ACTN|nr:RDD family protein [Parenemella sanctibonifatiensis]OYN88550.1 hypothetical protein CGZ91_13120 [Parenemella sanctibonifatiensis]